jgi:hypothetical protein
MGQPGLAGLRITAGREAVNEAHLRRPASASGRRSNFRPAEARWNSAGSFFLAVPSGRALAGSSPSGSPNWTTKLSCER